MAYNGDLDGKKAFGGMVLGGMDHQRDIEEGSAKDYGVSETVGRHTGDR
jgi:hypothetical protein